MNGSMNKIIMFLFFMYLKKYEIKITFAKKNFLFQKNRLNTKVLQNILKTYHKKL